MAIAEQVATLRRLINEPDDVAPYTDAELAARLDANLGRDLRNIAADMWREKAAGYASLVDVQEGGSNRKLSQLYKQALDVATQLDGSVAAAVVELRRGTRTRRIERQ